MPTDINRIESQTAVTIYPNPASDVLNIEGTDNGETICIYNDLGVEVMETWNRTIDISSFSTGIYFVKVQNRSLRLSNNDFDTCYVAYHVVNALKTGSIFCISDSNPNQ